MLFRDAICIFCHSRSADIRHRHGGIGVCPKCFDRLPSTGENRSFNAENDAVDYVISPFYYTDVMRDAILSYKFNGDRAYSRVFFSLMTESLERIKYILGDFDMLIPVPLSKKRMNERGYNQAELIAKPFAEFIGTQYRGDILRRDINTRRQADLRSYERMTNVYGAFSASEDAAGQNIIIFDDIYTTGATAAECARTLKAAGAKDIIALTLAITERRQERPAAVFMRNAGAVKKHRNKALK